MASGWGITGNKGRCYDFWIDFSQCMCRCPESKHCALLREDYFDASTARKRILWERRNLRYQKNRGLVNVMDLVVVVGRIVFMCLYFWAFMYEQPKPELKKLQKLDY